jgi:alpha-tubulin suppressor-like RCC1 family protein
MRVVPTALVLAFSAGVVAGEASAQVSALRFQSLALAETFTCGLAPTGEAWCWGDNGDGQLGAAVKRRSPQPVAVAGGHRFAQLVVASSDLQPGGSFACGLTPEGSALCWGDNDLGQLGDGGTKSRSTPAPVAGGLLFESLRATATSVCGIEKGGRVHYWGAFGQLAYAMPGSSVALQTFSQPTAIEQPPAASLVADAMGTTCALSAAGVVHCWQLSGSNLAIGPVTPPDRAFRAVALSSSFSRSCGLTTAGELLCWQYQQDPNRIVLSVGPAFIGTGGVLTVDELAPGVRFRDLARAESLWALAEDGALHRVPGGVEDGTLGALPPGRPRLAPVTTAARFATLARSASVLTLFALTESGEAWGWGSNSEGQLGVGSKEFLGIDPVRAAPGPPWAWIGARNGGACALTAEGAAYCWGRNEAGQVGDGTTKPKLAPAPVAAPAPAKR